MMKSLIAEQNAQISYTCSLVRLVAIPGLSEVNLNNFPSWSPDAGIQLKACSDIFFLSSE